MKRLLLSFPAVWEYFLEAKIHIDFLMNLRKVTCLEISFARPGCSASSNEAPPGPVIVLCPISRTVYYHSYVRIESCYAILHLNTFTAIIWCTLNSCLPSYRLPEFYLFRCKQFKGLLRFMGKAPQASWFRGCAGAWSSVTQDTGYLLSGGRRHLWHPNTTQHLPFGCQGMLSLEGAIMFLF